MSTSARERFGLSIDRWHYLDYRDGRHDEKYVEWKYFNFVDGETAGYIVYYVLDPEEKTSLGGGRLLVRVFKGDRIFGTIKRVPVGALTFSGRDAGATMDAAIIEEEDPYHYRIAGALDGMTWDLRYAQKAPTIQAFEDVRWGKMRWERMNWIVKMPSASVEGTIRAESETFSIRGLGYTDTNWGEILPFLSRYEWGQFNDGRLSFVYGTIYKMGKAWRSYAYARFGGEKIDLENCVIKAAHTRWERGAGTSIRIPTASVFTIRSGMYTLVFSTRLVHSDILTLKLLPGFPKPVIVEELVRYEGTLARNGEVLHRFEGIGFEEWSSRTWGKAPIVF